MQQNKNETLYIYFIYYACACYVNMWQKIKSLKVFSLILVLHFYFAKYEIYTECPQQLTNVDKTSLV